MELKGIELAKLDAKIEYSKALVSQNENTIKRQQEEIDRLFKLLQESLGQKVQIVK
jgi:undecaprenyl pyrophosphate synthase